MKKLLANNMETMRSAKRILNRGADLQAITDALIRERTALKSLWLEPEFPDKMMLYLLSLRRPKNAMSDPSPKL